MPTNPNMVAIETVTVPSGGAASIEFTSIPQTYTDLVVLWTMRASGATVATYISFNGSTSNFSGLYLYGNGSSPASGTLARYVGSCPGTNFTSDVFANSSLYIPQYAGSTNKSFSVDNVDENNATGNDMNLIAGLWSDTAAITSITLTLGSGNFVEHSSATLYGVTAFVGEESAKAIGGVVTSDSNYWYHTFTSTGMFTPTQNVTADYLVVAGGGGGGFDAGGGGGAGGYRYFTSQSLASSTNYTVLVGAGGGGSTAGANKGGNGTASTFNSISSSGGGGGGSGANTSGASGGSGGGGRANGGSGGAGNAGSYSPVEGYAGGTSPNPGAGSGGGGSAAVGQNSTTTTTGGNGGAATSNSISGTAVNYAGGGGGARNTSTGGGAGADASGAGAGGTTVRGVGSNATANLGGGGGAGGTQLAGGSGGSGIVIVRYAK